MFVVTVLLVVTFLAALYSWFRLIRETKRTNVPGPMPLPFVGNGHLFMLNVTRDFVPKLVQLAEKYNDVFFMQIFSHKYVVISHPKYLAALLSSTETITKGRSYEFLVPWMGQGILTSSGLRWQKHRKLLTPAFHFNILRTYLPVFTKTEKILIRKLSKLADGRNVELFSIMALAALDAITESITGVSHNAQTDNNSEYEKAITDLSDILMFRMRNLLATSEAIFNLLPHKARQDKMLKLIHGESNKVIEKRRRELEKLNISKLNSDTKYGVKTKHAFLDLLLLSEINGEKIDYNSIREEVDTFLFAGYDTITSAVVFILFNLAKHKDVQEKVWAEQQQIFGDNIDRDVTFNDLNEMKYLQLVIKESLRLHPAVPLMERRMVQDTKLLDLDIKKDITVVVNIFRTHRNPHIYEDPLEFRPERFEKPTTTPFDWIAFSAGPRNCIGQKYAMMELKVMVSSIIRNFKLFPSETEPILTGSLVLRSANGVHVKLLPRRAS